MENISDVWRTPDLRVFLQKPFKPANVSSLSPAANLQHKTNPPNPHRNSNPDTGF